MPYKDPDKQRKFQRESVARNRHDYLKDKSCLICGTTDMLQVDHIDPELKISHRIWSWSYERRMTELLKCQILCRVHHWEKTKRDHGWFFEHGRATGYTNYKCRCSECRSAHATEMREWRARKRGS